MPHVVRSAQNVSRMCMVRGVENTAGLTGRIFEGTGEIVLADGSVAVEASGRYLKLPIDRIAEGDFTSEWFPDTRELPGSMHL